MHQDEDSTGLFRRDGHLTELTLDRVVHGECSPQVRQEVDAHLEGCEACSARLGEVESFEAGFLAGPLGQPSWLQALEGSEAPQSAAPEVISLEAARAKRIRRPRAATWVTGTLLAAAAGVALMLAIQPTERKATPGGGQVVGPGDPGDGIQIKGRLFSFQIHAFDDVKTRVVGTGDEVHPGERIGFSVYPRVSGHLMIVGVDERHGGYLCYPQDQKASKPIEALARGKALDEAMRLDPVLGKERVVALLCPSPFDFESVQPALEQASRGTESGLSLAKLKEGCLQQEIVLDKRASGE